MLISLRETSQATDWSRNVVCSSSVCLTCWHSWAGAGRSWSRGTVAPPQCPVDSQVLKLLFQLYHLTWRQQPFKTRCMVSGSLGDRHFLLDRQIMLCALTSRGQKFWIKGILSQQTLFLIFPELAGSGLLWLLQHVMFCSGVVWSQQALFCHWNNGARTFFISWRASNNKNKKSCASAGIVFSFHFFQSALADSVAALFTYLLRRILKM